MLDFLFEADLTELFRRPKQEVESRVRKAFNKTKSVLVKAYKKEAPVDQDNLRGEVTAVISNDDLKVTTLAKNRGFSYPLAVHEGTGRYRGAADSGYTSGRVRQSSRFRDKKGKLMKREDIIGFFAGLRARGVQLSIRPNKFAKRALESSQREIDSIFEEVLSP